MTAHDSSEQQYPDFEFDLRELAGSLGDFGTLFPLGLTAVVLVLLLRENRYAPAALVLMIEGLIEVAIGLFLSVSIANIWRPFPSP